jgi:hypothetical protein
MGISGLEIKQPIALPPPPDPDPYQDPVALAVVAEVVERGDLASVSGILSREGVSPEDFARRFTTLEDCAVDAFERFIATFERRVVAAFNAQPDWRSSLRAAAYEVADFIEEDRVLTQFGLTGVLGMKSEMARVRREEVLIFGADLIDLGRNEPGADVGGDEAAATFAIGTIIQVLTHRTTADGPIEPHAIVPEILHGIVKSYLGEEAAREELALACSAAPWRSPSGSRSSSVGSSSVRYLTESRGTDNSSSAAASPR